MLETSLWFDRHIKKSVFGGELPQARFRKIKQVVMQLLDPDYDFVIYFSDCINSMATVWAKMQLVILFSPEPKCSLTICK